MPFARDWNLVPVTGQFIASDGEAIVGRLVFTPVPTRMVDAAALQTIIKRPYEVYLNALGAFRVELPATNDPDITPIDFTYQVTEEFNDGGGSTYSIDVSLLYLESGVDISQLAHVAPADGVVEDVTREEFDELVATVESLEHYDGGWSDSFYAGEVDGGDAEMAP